MSAYVCENKTINKIVAGILHAVVHGDFNQHYPRPPQALIDMIDLNNPQEFGATLRAMNVNAVEQRYPDCVGHPDRLPGRTDENDYVYQPMGAPNRIQFHKCLTGYLYQCSEGDVDELPLYRYLNDFANRICTHIVTHSPEWEKAEWAS